MSEKRKPRPASTANARATVKAIKRMQRAKADRAENTTTEAKRWAFLDNTKQDRHEEVQDRQEDEELEEPIPTDELMRQLQQESNANKKKYKQQQQRRSRTIAQKAKTKKQNRKYAGGIDKTFPITTRTTVIV